MLRAVLVEEKRRKNLKATWEYYYPGGKDQCPISQYTPYKSCI